MSATTFPDHYFGFEGKIVVQSAGDAPSPSNGKSYPATAVELAGNFGPIGLGHAIGSIARAYLEGAPEELRPVLASLITFGMNEALNASELVTMTRGGVN